MITCQLTKLETALDQLRKQHPDMNPADAAMVASALSITGRHALAVYEGETFAWPDDNQKLVSALIPGLKLATEGVEATAPKKTSKAAQAEEEPVQFSVGLMPNFSAGEELLKDRDDLKTMLSDLLQEGVEFNYGPTDIGWQWALDRVNWATVSDTEISRRIKVKAIFTQGAVGVETGTQTKKRAGAKKTEEE